MVRNKHFVVRLQTWVKEWNSVAGPHFLFVDDWKECIALKADVMLHTVAWPILSLNDLSLHLKTRLKSLDEAWRFSLSLSPPPAYSLDIWILVTHYSSLF